MSTKLISVFCGTLFVIALNMPIRAQAQTKQDVAVCTNVKGDPDQIIRACSTFARSGTYAGKRINNKIMSAMFALRGEAYRKTYQPDLALADFNRSIDLFPQNGGYALRGVLYNTSFATPTQAIFDFNEAVRITPKNPEPLSLRADVYLSQGDLERARSDLDQAIRIGPKFAMAYFNRGRYHAIKGDTAQATADFDKAKQLDPKIKGSVDFESKMLLSWLQYLKEVQQDQDYANWSGPPLNANTR